MKKPVALFVTYTMLEPIVGGAFFRALRLASELNRRGWSPIICNHGPMLDDPKVDNARGSVQFIQLDREAPGFSSSVACRQFAALNPTVVIMGEGPIAAMEVFYEGARAVKRPFVVLDQYYNHWLLPRKEGVDLALLYGLRTFWKGELHLSHPYMMVPPFIDRIIPKAEIPIPAHLHALPWLTLIAYESSVLQKGIELLGGLGECEAAIIVVSRDPREAARLLDAAGIADDRTAVLPLQSDAVIFGLVGASRVALVSNGFLQIMESLAMGCPVIALERGSGVGMGSLNIDRRFVPFVSFGEPQSEQRARIQQWLSDSPFPQLLRDALQTERGGIRTCADRIEALVQRRQSEPWFRRGIRRTLAKTD